MSAPHLTLSHFNDRHTAITPQRRIVINDCTLREGEQSAIVNFQPEQKKRLARSLVENGITSVQLGYAGLSHSDRQAFRELADEGLPCELESVVLTYLDSWREQIEASAACGASVVNLVHVPSPPRREKVFLVSPADIRERTSRAVEESKKHGLFVTYSPADTSRTELEVALDLVKAAEEAGADRIAIADTLGAATPGAIRFLVEQTRAVTSLQLAFHGHNDFGLAMANALAALEAGVEVVDATLNGWGDRTGNPPTEEVAAALQFLYGACPELDVAGLAVLAKEAASLLGVDVPPTKPITGEVAFAHKLETHVKAVLSYPPAFEAFDPVLVGGARHVAIGQYSGPNAIRARLASIGLSSDETTLQRLTTAVQEAARRTNRVLSDKDLRGIATELGVA